VFNDPNFAATSSRVDKRGRKLEEKKAVGDEFRKFYEMDEPAAEEAKDESAKKSKKDKKKKHEEEEAEEEEKRDIARFGMASDVSSSSSSEASDVYDEEEDAILDALVAARSGQGEVQLMEDEDEPTRRMACVNVNWDVMSSIDILAVMKSFCPPSGVVKRVSVYPSNFGSTQMALEDVHGPILDYNEKEFEGTLDEDRKKRAMDNALRKYELERRRYFFSVIECDSPATCSTIYNACDGLGIEATGSVLDLRFIPNEEDFSSFKHRDFATFVPQNYVPPVSSGHADGYSRTTVDLNWDETPAGRLRVTQRKPTTEDALEDMDFMDLMASDSSGLGSDDESSELRVEDDEDDDEDEKERKKVVEEDEAAEANREELKRAKLQKKERMKEKIRRKYAALLEAAQPDEPEEQEEMIVTFQSGLEEAAEDALKEKAEFELLKQQTPFEKQLAEKSKNKKEKKAARAERIRQQVEEQEAEKKERKKKRERQGEDADDEEALKRRQELGLLVMGEKKRKKKPGLGDEEEVLDIAQDDRFSSLLTRPEYAIDKTDQRFKSTKSMDKLLGKIREKRPSSHVQSSAKPQMAGSSSGGSMDSLVASVKAKAAAKLKKQQKKK
jgi:hypothetical protein